MIFSKKITYSALLIAGLVIIAVLIIPKEQVEVSNPSWKYKNGQYWVSFQATNNTKSDLEAKIRINLHQRNFAAGSPKAEVIDIVGTITIWAPISAKQTVTINETVKPQKPTFKIDFISTNVIHIQTLDT